MVNLQKEHDPLMMKSRMKNRKELEFDPERTLTFEKRTVKDLCKRDYYFRSFRRLHYDIIVEGAKTRADDLAEARREIQRAHKLLITGQEAERRLILTRVITLGKDLGLELSEM